MHLRNFIFTRTLFLIASYQILQNDAILINHESFFQEKRMLITLPFPIFGNKFFNG